MKWIDKLLGKKSKEFHDSVSVSAGPETAKNHYQLGWGFHEKEKFDQAITEYKKALQIDPDYALARSNLGMAYKQQGKLDEAIKEWEDTLLRGATSVVRMNTEDWLKEAKALRDMQSKPVVEVEGELKSNLEELGKASDSWYVAYKAIERVGSSAIPALIQSVESENDLLRSRSIDLLGKIGDKSAIPVLEKAAKLSEQDFRKITGITSSGRQVKMGGAQFEVSIKDMLDEYHRYARDAIKNIKKRI